MRLSDLQLQYQSYMGDYAWFFTINTNLSGYTRDKKLFHVLDKSRNAYTSYDENKGEMSSFLNNLNNNDVVLFNQNNGNGNKNGNNWDIDTSQIPWIPIAIGGIIILALIFAK